MDLTTKAKALRKHAKARAIQRYAVLLTSKDLLNIRDLIQSGKAQFLEHMTLDRGLFQVEYKERVMKVIYSKRHKTIVTVLK